MLFSHYAPTALPQLAPENGAGRLRVNNPWLRRDHSAACPLCVQVSGGRWLLSWRLKWTFLCADHLVYLVDRCPRCDLRLYWRIEATGTGQRLHCIRPTVPGRRRLGAGVCGFPVAEIPVIPVEAEEAIHLQRRVSTLLTPADAPHNDTSRRLLQHMSRVVHDAATRKSAVGLLGRMENTVVRSVYETQELPWQPMLGWTLERGSPAAVSALVRIAARTVLSDNPRSGPLERRSTRESDDVQRVIGLASEPGGAQLGRLGRRAPGTEHAVRPSRSRCRRPVRVAPRPRRRWRSTCRRSG